MPGDALKLTVYAGERDRAGERLLAGALIDIFERRGIRSSVLLRGIEGFGIKHRLQTERLLSLSEDLPMVAVAVDRRDVVEAAIADVRAATRHGVITLERALLLGAGRGALAPPPGPEELKLTVYLGRGERAGGRPAHLVAIELLHRHGVAGASVLLGLDGTAHGVRQRARFLAGNARVPLMIISVGDRASIGRALEALRSVLRDPIITLERVTVCKRDGVLLAEPTPPPAERGGLIYWQKLTVYSGGRSEHEGRPLQGELIRRLRRAGAAGATAIRGQWGYHGAHRPHGERFWSLRRHVPVLTVILDRPADAERWFAIVDELTDETGLVTSELVPALRAAGPDIEHGGLALAVPHGFGVG